MKFSIKDFFSQCDQICSFLRIWSPLLKKSLMENFIFCAVVKQVFQKTCQNSQKSFWIKISFSKKRLRHEGFLVNFAKLLRTSFFQNTYGPLIFRSVAFVIMQINDKDWSTLSNFSDQKTRKVCNHSLLWLLWKWFTETSVLKCSAE